MPSSHYKTEGLVIKKLAFGEADFLVRVLTGDFGKLDLIAKGARKTGSKLNFHLDLLNLVRIMFIRNGERLPTLTDAEIISRNDDWFSDSNRISVAGRLIKTLDLTVMPYSEDKRLFEMTSGFFGQVPEKLNEGDAINFLKAVFTHEGYGNSLPPEHMDNIMKLWPNFANQ